MTRPPPPRRRPLAVMAGPTSLPLTVRPKDFRDVDEPPPPAPPALWTRVARAALRVPTEREAEALARAAIRLGLVAEGAEPAGAPAEPDDPPEPPPDGRSRVHEVAWFEGDPARVPPIEPGDDLSRIPGLVCHFRADDAVQVAPGLVLMPDRSGNGHHQVVGGSIVNDPRLGKQAIRMEGPLRFRIDADAVEPVKGKA